MHITAKKGREKSLKIDKVMVGCKGRGVVSKADTSSWLPEA